MACLADPKVRRELGDAEDETNDLMRALQDANELAGHLLESRGCNGRCFLVKLNEVEVDLAPITVKHSKARV